MSPQLLTALTRLLGITLLTAAAFFLGMGFGLAACGLALLAVTYMPEGDA